HGGRFFGAHRGWTIDHIAEQLRGDDTQSDHHERAESYILQRTDDDLDAPLRHRAKEHALDHCIRPLPRHTVRQLAVYRERLALGRDVDAHATDLALVRDVR